MKINGTDQYLFKMSIGYVLSSFEGSKMLNYLQLSLGVSFK